MVVIHEPIWCSSSIGIANYKLQGETVDIEIDYKDKQGRRVWPNTYRIRCDKARQYPIQRVNRGVSVHIIPIKDLELL